MLRELGAEVAYHDPHVPALAEFGLSSADLDAEVASADLVAIVTAHPEIDYDGGSRRRAADRSTSAASPGGSRPRTWSGSEPPQRRLR